MKPQANYLDSGIEGMQVFSARGCLTALEILPFYNSFATLRSSDFAAKHESIKSCVPFSPVWSPQISVVQTFSTALMFPVILGGNKNKYDVPELGSLIQEVALSLCVG